MISASTPLSAYKHAFRETIILLLGLSHIISFTNIGIFYDVA
jgi:hypothetical protein